MVTWNIWMQSLMADKDFVGERMKQRAQQATQLKAEFKGDVPLVVHWDGKLLPDLTGNEQVDRLPVIVSGKCVSQLLTVAKLPSGTGQAQATAVYEAVEDWGVSDRICAMCFDTTASNTGRLAGACVLLEQKLGRELLSLACRHHILELVVGAVFEACLGVKSAPEVQLFKRFRHHLGLIDQEKFETALESETVSLLVQDIRDNTVEFANKQLEQHQPRYDYIEFLELVLIFLGSKPTRGIRFMAPGAMHHARWMSKVLYSLKIWIFRSQFKLTANEEKGVQDICVFAARLYLKAWITAPLSSSAPYSDFLLLKELLDYSTINKAISKAASKKFAGHLWYLSPELIALALFDDRVSSETKRLMVHAMKNEDNPEHDYTKHITVDLALFRDKRLEQFVSAQSKTLFQILKLPDTFLTTDPDSWHFQEEFQQTMETVYALKVVNDHAERGVALIQEFTRLMTHDEPQFQFLLQVAQKHRDVYPDSKKETLAANAAS